jgi:hypothetical protein
VGVLALPRSKDLWKPPLGVVLDWNNPSTNALNVAVLANEAGGTSVKEHVSGQLGTFSSATNVKWVATPYGPGLDFANVAGTTVQWAVGAVPRVAPTNTVMLIFQQRTTGATSFGSPINHEDTSAGVCNVFHSNASGTLEFGSGGSNYSTTLLESLTVWHTASWIASAGASMTIIDGAFGPGTNSGSSGASLTRLTLSDPSFNFDGVLALALIWGRVLPDAERVYLAQRPFSLWKRQPARRLMVFGVGGGTVQALSGTAAVSISGAGSPTVIVPLAGVATLDYTATGGPTLTLPLVGTAAVSLTAAGGPKANANLSGTGAVDLTVLGTPVVTLRLAGTGSADITGGGALSNTAGGTVALAGTAIVNLTGSGGTQIAVPLSGTSQVSVTGAGSPQQTVRLTGRASVDVTAAATLGPLTPFAPTHSTTYGVQPLAGDTHGTVSVGGTYGVLLEPETAGGVSGGQAFGAVAFTSQGDRA